MSDPACLTMSLSHPVNKSLQMDPPASRFIPHSVTEYSASQGPSNFSQGRHPGMDTARLLLALEQGTRTLEGYIQEYLDTAHFSDLPDYVLIDFFFEGTNQPLKSKLRREGLCSSLCLFLDFALLCVGSPFTVGVAEEERDNAVMAAAHPARKMAAASQCVHTMVATAEPMHKVVAKTKLCHVTAAISEPSKVAAVFPESSQVAAVFPESSHVAAVFPESSQVAAVFPESSQVAAVFPESSQATAVVPESSQVKTVFPESSQVAAVFPESSQS
ncbi:hypothetical protein M9458_007666, partial [Cirrhinus mrigala]